MSSQFDIEQFARLLDAGLSRDEAAQQCGVARKSIYTLLYRRGYRLRCTTTTRWELVPCTETQTTPGR